jgi:hypothetical protein
MMYSRYENCLLRKSSVTTCVWLGGRDRAKQKAFGLLRKMYGEPP